jgi:hypothetical protein
MSFIRHGFSDIIICDSPMGNNKMFRETQFGLFVASKLHQDDFDTAPVYLDSVIINNQFSKSGMRYLMKYNNVAYLFPHGLT